MNENAESVKERPILFSGPMVRAILNGQKHVTRRPVVSLAGGRSSHVRYAGKISGLSFNTLVPNAWSFRDSRKRWNDVPDLRPYCPFGSRGDRLWVRETFYPIWREDHTLTALYRADGITLDTDDTGKQLHWKPAIHMPRPVSRLTLEIRSIIVERLHAITEDAAWDEGIDELDGHFSDADLCATAKKYGLMVEDARATFAHLWDKTYAARGMGWADNPWVWVVEFRPLEAA